MFRIWKCLAAQFLKVFLKETSYVLVGAFLEIPLLINIVSVCLTNLVEVGSYSLDI